MGDEGSEPRRRPHDDELTRVDAPQARVRSEPPASVPDAEPTRPMADVRGSGSEETLRIRPDQINRRALPFKKSGGARRKLDSEPATDPVLTETGEMPKAPPTEPALPFDALAGSHDASQSLPPDPSPLPHQQAPQAFAESVWSRDAVINAADLPSALAPQAGPIPSAPPPARSRIDPITLITMMAVVLVLLMCALALLL